VRHHGGAAALDRLLREIDESDRQALTRTLLPMGWYPFELNERLDRAIVKVIGESSPKRSTWRPPDASGSLSSENVFRLLGSSSASHNLGTSHKVYVRERDPHGLLKQAAAIFRLYYDTGYRTYERTGDRRATLRTFECQSFSEADCLTVVGWHEKAIELCGGRAPKVTEPLCRARGNDTCEYRCEWE
jgi:hypothetical protein